MIGGLLSDLASRGAQADVTLVDDDTLTVSLDPDGATSLSADGNRSVHVRVAQHGKVGWAAGATHSVRNVVDAAFRSAACGAPAPLFLPAPAPLPSVMTRSPGAAALGARDLHEYARQLRERLGRHGWQLESWAERSAGAVEVGNTRGVQAAYDVSLVGVGVEARAPDGMICRVYRSQVAPFESQDLAALVDEVERQLLPPLLADAPAVRTERIWFGPRAVRALLAPLLPRLIGERWAAGRDRWPELDRRLTLIDDPLLDGRPGSRPICDDGVPTRRITLIDAGRPAEGILDLTVASRTCRPATGHGWRRGFAPPRAGFSNLVLRPGTATTEQLAREVGSGLFVADWSFGTAPNLATGVFRAEAPWTYRMDGGTVTGRLDGVVLTGDTFELLARVVAVGAPAEWVGGALLPSLVVDGVGVELRH
ncbi:MAG: metallopeptidase TldD-related protein [Gemmatimonadales bacterium]